ncbi:uncharacterized protein LOC128161677 [Crassostrea angulata]|uniref:uncharacterized protein LOC128161677 n=1 Tax=Magallana angulata TaxID=2784310 RepID=UPI0022B0D12C|nr:uncharacterized protein LOC128161677 [Crassostrea angulata]
MKWRTHVFVVLFQVHVNICFSHQCFPNEIQTFLKGKLADSDFTSLLSLEDNSYGKLFHKCLFYCEKDKRCIGFQICKISETLFQCRTCCEWKKAKGFTFTYSPDCKYVEMKIDFETNLAFNRTAILSSEFDEMHKASNAVDGIKMCFSYNLVASSSRSIQPWLLIQLDAIYSIGKVVVYARNDRYANEANNIIVYIKDIDVSNVCGGIYQGPTFNSDVIYFMCPSESRGNSVHIQKTTRGQLGFCEIEVYE